IARLRSRIARIRRGDMRRQTWRGVRAAQQLLEAAWRRRHGRERRQSWQLLLLLAPFRFSNLDWAAGGLGESESFFPGVKNRRRWRKLFFWLIHPPPGVPVIICGSNCHESGKRGRNL